MVDKDDLNLSDFRVFDLQMLAGKYLPYLPVRTRHGLMLGQTYNHHRVYNGILKHLYADLIVGFTADLDGHLISTTTAPLGYSLSDWEGLSLRIWVPALNFKTNYYAFKKFSLGKPLFCIRRRKESVVEVERGSETTKTLSSMAVSEFNYFDSLEKSSF